MCIRDRGYTNGESTGVSGASDIYSGIRYIAKNVAQRDFSYKFEVEAGEYTVYAEMCIRDSSSAAKEKLLNFSTVKKYFRLSIFIS